MEGAVLKRGVKVWVRNPYVRKIPSILSSPPLPSAPLSSPAPSSLTPSAPGAVDAGTVVGYHHVEDDARYRSSWLPRDLSGVPPFIPGEISSIELASGRLAVTTLLSPPLSIDTTVNEVWPLNPSTGLDDCSAFTYIHEADVTYSLAKRCIEGKSVTRIASALSTGGGNTAGSNASAGSGFTPVTLVMTGQWNGKDVNGVSLSDPIYMARYRAQLSARSLEGMAPTKRAKFTLPPHVYEVADRAYNTLTNDLASQAVVLLGQTGSGKSEVAKALLHFWLSIPALEMEGIHPEMLAAIGVVDEGVVAPTSAPGSGLKGGGRRPPLLASPDFSSAVRDSNSRSGHLGGAANPFLSQLTWGKGSATETRASGTPFDAARYMYKADLTVGNTTNSINRGSGTFSPAVFESDAAIRLGARFGPLQGGILAAEVVLDNFGVAQTASHYRSSRFTKLTKVFYTPAGAPVGAHFTVGLLEKARAGERAGYSSAGAALAAAPFASRGGNFLVFHRLAAGASKSQKLEYSILPAAEYTLLAGDAAAGGNADGSDAKAAAEFEALGHALTQVGVTPAVQAQVWQMLAGLLLAGNIRVTDVDGAYVATPSTMPGPGAAVITNPEDAVRAAELLGLPRNIFTDTMVRRSRGTVEGSVGTSSAVTWLYKKGSEVRTTLRAFISDCYGHLVAWLVQQINASLKVDTNLPSEPLYLAVLDGGGLDGAILEGTPEGDWWAAPHNLDTLVHNYYTEKAEELYLACLFKAERLVYESERVEVPVISFMDNINVVELIDDRRMGMLNQLEEANSFTRSTDASFMSKVYHLHKKNPVLVRPSDARDDATCLLFGVRHTGSCVTYSAAGFLTANKDCTDAELSAAARASSLVLLRNLYPPSDSTSKAAPGLSVAVSSMQDANVMFQSIALSQFQFIRCLAPNTCKKQNFVEPAHILAQLTASSTIPAIQLRHSGYPYKNSYADFYERYILLAHRGGDLVFPPPLSSPLRDLCKQLLAQLVAHPVFAGMDIAASARFGVTKVFLKKDIADALEALREVRLTMMDRCAARIQATWRGFALRRRLLSMWEGVRRMQAAWRTLRVRALWLHTRNAASKIQAFVCFRQTRLRFLRLRQAALRVQAWFKRCSLGKRWKQMQQGVRALHALARGYVIRCHVMRMLASVTKLQAVVRRYLARCRMTTMRSGAAEKYQAAWRAYRFRIDNEDVLQYLAWRRAERNKNHAVAVVQAHFRGKRVFGSYRALRAAACALQRWMHTKLAKHRFQRTRAAVCTIQAIVRGFLARQSARQLKTLQLIGDELWRVSIVRERECVELARQRSEEVLNSMKPYGGAPATLSQPILDASPRIARTAVSPTRTVTVSSGPGAHGSVKSPPPGRRGQSPQGIMPFSHGALGGVPSASPPHPVSAAAPGGALALGMPLGLNGSVALAATSSSVFPVNVFTDVDTLTDTSLVYPASWARAVNNLERDMRSSGSRMAQVATGGMHTLVLSEAGHVFSFGFSDRGQCGHGRFTGESKPRLVSALLTDRHLTAAQATRDEPVAQLTGRAIPVAIRIKSIACGEEHSLALSDVGTLYAWGAGRRGQSGLGSRDTVSVPTAIPFPSSGEGLMETETKVSEVAAGAYHSVALLSSGVVFTWGDAACLGNNTEGEANDALEPQPVKALARTRIRRIASGPSFVVVVSTAGDVYTWGSGKEGQLGLGEDVSRRRIKNVDAQTPAEALLIEAASVDQHVLPDAAEYEYVTGRFRARLTPTLVEGLGSFGKHSRIVHVACGAHHCAALSSTGRVYVWGSNSHGQLGLGCIGAVSQRVLQDFDAPIPHFPLYTDRNNHALGYTPRPWVATPVFLKGLELRHIITIVAGRRATYAVTDMNEMLAWGFTTATRKLDNIKDIAAKALEAKPGSKFNLDKLYSDDGSASSSHAFLLTPVPTDVPIHELPGRSIRRIFASHSSSISVAGVSFMQHQVTEAQLREFTMSKALSTLRTSREEENEASEFPVLSTNDFLARLLAEPAHTAAPPTRLLTLSLSPSTASKTSPKLARYMQATPESGGKKAVRIAATPKQVGKPGTPSLPASASRRQLIVDALVRGAGSPKGAPLSSPSPSLSAMKVARDALLSPTSSKGDAPDGFTSPVRTTTVPKLEDAPTSRRPVGGIASTTTLSPEAEEARAAKRNAFVVDILRHPRAAAALLSIPPSRLQQLSRLHIRVLAMRLRKHAEANRTDSAALALLQSQRQSLARPARSSVNLLKTLLDEKAAVRLLESAVDSPSRTSSAVSTPVAADESLPRARASQRMVPKPVRARPSVVDISRLLQGVQQKQAPKPYNAASTSVVAVAVPTVPSTGGADATSPNLARGMSSRRLISGAVAVTSANAPTSPDPARVHVGLLPMHEYVMSLLNEAKLEDANHPILAPSPGPLSSPFTTEAKEGEATFEAPKHASVRSFLTNAHNQQPMPVAPPPPAPADPVASASVRERALEVAAQDAGVIHSAAREELAARVAELKAELEGVRHRSALSS